MNTINFIKVGSGFRLVVTDDPILGNVDEYKNRSGHATIRENLNGSVLVSIDKQDYFVTHASQLLFEGVAASDTNDMYSKFSALFPDSSGGSVAPVTLTDPASYTLPAGKLITEIVLQPSSDATVKVGFTAGGQEIFPPTAVAAATGLPIATSIYSKTVSQTIYFTGLPSGSHVQLIIQDMP